MLRDGSFKKVVVIAGFTDLRKGNPGLSAIVRLRYGLDPLEDGTLYLFCGRKRSVIKGIYYEGDGPAVVTKRLLDGAFQWPRKTQEAIQLSPEQFQRLMTGFPVDSSIRFPVLSEES